MYRKAVFGRSRREIVLAPHSAEQLEQAIVWFVLAFTQALVNDFRTKPNPGSNAIKAMTDLVDHVTTGLFGVELDKVAPDFLQRYRTEDVLFEIALQHESGNLPLRSSDKGHRAPYLSRRSAWWYLARMGRPAGFTRPWSLLEDLADTLAYRKCGSFEADAAASLCKRLAPVLPQLRSVGTLGASNAASFCEFLNSWTVTDDMALVLVP